MLDIETFDNARGGNVAYKALAHPLAAARLAAMAQAASIRSASRAPDIASAPLSTVPPSIRR